MINVNVQDKYYSVLNAFWILVSVVGTNKHKTMYKKQTTSYLTGEVTSGVCGQEGEDKQTNWKKNKEISK